MTKAPIRASDGGPVSWLVDLTSRAISRVGLHAVVEASIGSLPSSQGPVLYCANHVSWWDGFLLRRFHQRRRSGPLYTIMLESELRRRPTLRRAGAIGLTPGSLPATRATARFLEGRPSDRRSSVCLFPQGRIWPSIRRPLGFEPGLRVFASAMGEPWIVPVGIHIEPLNHFRPTAFVLTGRAVRWETRPTVRSIEVAVEALLDRIQNHIDQWGESAGDHPVSEVAPQVELHTSNEMDVLNG